MEQFDKILLSTLNSPQERGRLVRLCSTITGHPDAAEDLAQETLLEAWRHLHELRDLDKQAQWLSGIARNVCLRWMRKRGRDQQHLIYLTRVESLSESELPTLEDSLADNFDIEFELERKELMALLDRAMELLPEETRAILIKRYVEESPIAEVAAQLGTNTSAVAMRLQRGKLALRRVLTEQMSDELASYGVQSDDEGWKQTRMWCTLCGQSRLVGRLVPSLGFIELHCPRCFPDDMIIYSSTSFPELLRSVRSYKTAHARLIKWSNSYYYPALRHGTTPCIGCGHPAPVLFFTPDEAPKWLRDGNRHGVRIACSHCASLTQTYLECLALVLPETQQFIHEHPRIHTLPECEIEIDGRLALVTTFESITDNARLTVISAKDNFEVLRIHGGE